MPAFFSRIRQRLTAPAADSRALVDATPRRGFIPMRWQRTLYSFLIAFGVSLYVNPSLWAHLDRIKHPHKTLLKWGVILIVDLTLFFLTAWAINGRMLLHRLYCFAAGLLLTVLMLVHAGALNRLEASHTENVEAVNVAKEGLKEIAGAQAEGTAKAIGETAMEANARGQRRLAATLGRQAGSASVDPEIAKLFIEKAATRQDETFLPRWYLDGAMYYALMAIAFVLGALAVLLSEDANGDNIPDLLQQLFQVRAVQPVPAMPPAAPPAPPVSSTTVNHFPGGTHVQSWSRAGGNAASPNGHGGSTQNP